MRFYWQIHQEERNTERIPKVLPWLVDSPPLNPYVDWSNRLIFPVVMKEHQSHDVLLLCPPCHQNSNMQDVRLRKLLAELCDAPLSGPSISVDDAYQSHWRRLRSAVRALRKESGLPEQRRLILESHVTELTGHDKVTPELLEELDQQIKTEPSTKSANTAHTPHGLKVRVVSRLVDSVTSKRVIEFFSSFSGGRVLRMPARRSSRIGTTLARAFLGRYGTKVHA